MMAFFKVIFKPISASTMSVDQMMRQFGIRLLTIVGAGLVCVLMTAIVFGLEVLWDHLR